VAVKHKQAICTRYVQHEAYPRRSTVVADCDRRMRYLWQSLINQHLLLRYDDTTGAMGTEQLALILCNVNPAQSTAIITSTACVTNHLYGIRASRAPDSLVILYPFQSHLIINKCDIEGCLRE
jgi:hypothetical protein